MFIESRRPVSSRCVLPHVFFLVFSLVLSSRVCALSSTKSFDQYLFRSWTIRDGLPQNSVQSIVQTRDGYLCFATQGGLARFNGREFRVFNPTNSPLRSQNITCLFEDSDNVLWIGTEAGLANYDDGAFALLGEDQGVDIGIVSVVSEDDEGRIWIGSQGKNLYVLTDGRLEPVLIDGERPHGGVNDILRGGDQIMWVATSEGLYRAQGGYSAFKRYGVEDGLPSKDIRALLLEVDGGVWVGTDKGLKRIGPVRIDGRADRVLLPGQVITRLMRDVHGNIWVGTAGSGVYRIAMGGKISTEALLTNVGKILAFEEDAEGSIWIGTPVRGVVQVRDSKLSIVAPYEYPLSNNTWSVLEDDRGGIWMATDSGLAMKGPGGISHFEKVANAPRGGVNAVYEARNGEIWIGTDSDGPVTYDGRRFDWWKRRFPELAGTRVRALFEDSSGVIYVGTRGRGLFLIENGRIIQHFHSANGLGSNRVISISEYGGRGLLISTWRGLLL